MEVFGKFMMDQRNNRKRLHNHQFCPTARTKHPLPLYTMSVRHKKRDLIVRTLSKGFNTIDRFMSETACTFVMDRLYDSNEMFKYITSIKKQLKKERQYLEEIEAA